MEPRGGTEKRPRDGRRITRTQPKNASYGSDHIEPYLLCQWRWEKIKTYIQLQAVIDERETLYTSYPFRDLAWLIRENYGGFGDAYNYQHYSRDTAIYYYANSIQWGLRTLEFNSDDELPKDLYVLVERYQKIEDMSPTGSNIHIYAGLLANAFLTLYNECVWKNTI